MLLNKKAQSDSRQIVIWAIVCIIILLIVGVFIFRANITNWLRNLPDYTTPEGKDIEINSTDNSTVSKICPGSDIGSFTAKSYNKWYYFPILFGASVGDSAYISVGPSGNRRLTKLWWIQTGEEAGQIQLDENVVFKDPVVGLVDSQMRISIYNQWMTDDVLRSKHPTIPSKEDLKLLNGAVIVSAGNLICK